VNDNIVVELKCPYSGKDKSVKDLVASGYKHVEETDGKFSLKNTSPYYCQVQGEMAIKKMSLCHVVVWTPITTEIMKVTFDKEFWSYDLLPKLVHFYKKHVAPNYTSENTALISRWPN